jgi:hypothetical protein
MSLSLAVSSSSNRNLSGLRELSLQNLRGLFDVDGVFSAPHRGTALPEREIVDLWVSALRRGLESSLATGRPGIWITQKEGVLGQARLMLEKDATSLSNLRKLPHFAENGAVILRADGETFTERVVNDEYQFPRRFETLARNLVQRLGIGSFAEFDASKSCVVSIYVSKEGFGQRDLEPHKDGIENAFRELISANNMNWVVARTAIAVDAYHKDVNKELAVNGYLSELRIPGNQPDIGLIAVGDSPSDFALYTALVKARNDGRLPKSAKLWFVFTGTEKSLEELMQKYQVPASSDELIFAGSLGNSGQIKVYSDATKQFLDSLLAA